MTRQELNETLRETASIATLAELVAMALFLAMLVVWCAIKGGAL